MCGYPLTHFVSTILAYPFFWSEWPCVFSGYRSPVLNACGTSESLRLDESREAYSLRKKYAPSFGLIHFQHFSYPFTVLTKFHYYGLNSFLKCGLNPRPLSFILFGVHKPAALFLLDDGVCTLPVLVCLGIVCLRFSFHCRVTLLIPSCRNR